MLGVPQAGFYKTDALSVICAVLSQTKTKILQFTEYISTPSFYIFDNTHFHQHFLLILKKSNG